MSTLLDDIAAATKGKSFKTYKYGFDGIDVPRFDYDDHRHQITWESYGETAYITKPKDMKPLADAYLQGPPLFSYFLDGSRKRTKLMIWLIKTVCTRLLRGKLAWVAALVKTWR